ISGPQQIQANLTSVPAVRSDLTLFQSQNSRVVYGNLLSLPTGGGMLYVEPLYIRSSAENYPLLRKVLLSYGKYVAYADNLQQGLDQLTAQAAGQPPTTTGTNPPPGGQPPSGALADAAARVRRSEEHTS